MQQPLYWKSPGYLLQVLNLSKSITCLLLTQMYDFEVLCSRLALGSSVDRSDVLDLIFFFPLIRNYPPIDFSYILPSFQRVEHHFCNLFNEQVWSFHNHIISYKSYHITLKTYWVIRLGSYVDALNCLVLYYLYLHEHLLSSTSNHTNKWIVTLNTVRCSSHVLIHVCGEWNECDVMLSCLLSLFSFITYPVYKSDSCLPNSALLAATPSPVVFCHNDVQEGKNFCPVLSLLAYPSHL